MRVKISHHVAGNFFALIDEDEDRVINRSTYEAGNAADQARAEKELRIYANGYMDGINDVRRVVTCHFNATIEEWKPKA